MYQVGFDVGGTNIAAGLVDENKTIIAERNRPFPLGSITRMWQP